MTDINIPIAFRFEAPATLPKIIKDAASKAELDFCDVTGFGQIENITFASLKTDEPLFLKGPFSLLNLKGRIRNIANISMDEFICTIARETDNGIETIGGKLHHASITWLELTIIPILNGEKTILNATDNSTATFSDAMGISNRIKQNLPSDMAIDDDPIPSAGDIVMHKQFGRCTVVKTDDTHIHLKKSNSHIVQLGLPILTFKKISEENNHSHWQVSIKKNK
jgi:predicted DNA-binding protein with PD1-like motif